MIKLQCENCGGRLEVEESIVSISSDEIYFINKGKQISCPHCGVEYLEEDQLKPVVTSGKFVITGPSQIGVIGDNTTIKGIHFS